MTTIKGSGGRLHAMEQAQRLYHLADELSSDLKYWAPHLHEKVQTECSGRILRLRAEAREFEMTVLEYDRRHGVMRGMM